MKIDAWTHILWPSYAAHRASIEAHYHADIRFTDADGEFVGYEALETFSDSLRARFPGERFEMVGRPDTLGTLFALTGSSAPVTGMNFVLLEGGKVRALSPSCSVQQQTTTDQNAGTPLTVNVISCLGGDVRPDR